MNNNKNISNFLRVSFSESNRAIDNAMFLTCFIIASTAYIELVKVSGFVAPHYTGHDYQNAYQGFLKQNMTTSSAEENAKVVVSDIWQKSTIDSVSFYGWLFFWGIASFVCVNFCARVTRLIVAKKYEFINFEYNTETINSEIVLAESHPVLVTPENQKTKAYFIFFYFPYVVSKSMSPFVEPILFRLSFAFLVCAGTYIYIAAKNHADIVNEYQFQLNQLMLNNNCNTDEAMFNCQGYASTISIAFSRYSSMSYLKNNAIILTILPVVIAVFSGLPRLFKRKNFSIFAEKQKQVQLQNFDEEAHSDNSILSSDLSDSLTGSARTSFSKHFSELSSIFGKVLSRDFIYFVLCTSAFLGYWILFSATIFMADQYINRDYDLSYQGFKKQGFLEEDAVNAAKENVAAFYEKRMGDLFSSYGVDFFIAATCFFVIDIMLRAARLLILHCYHIISIEHVYNSVRNENLIEGYFIDISSTNEKETNIYHLLIVIPRWLDKLFQVCFWPIGVFLATSIVSNLFLCIYLLQKNELDRDELYHNYLNTLINSTMCQGQDAMILCEGSASKLSNALSNFNSMQFFSGNRLVLLLMPAIVAVVSMLFSIVCNMIAANTHDYSEVESSIPTDDHDSLISSRSSMFQPDDSNTNLTRNGREEFSSNVRLDIS